MVSKKFKINEINIDNSLFGTTYFRIEKPLFDNLPNNINKDLSKEKNNNIEGGLFSNLLKQSQSKSLFINEVEKEVGLFGNNNQN